MSTDTASLRVDYRTEPSRYRHWKLGFEGEVARLALDIAEDGGIRIEIVPEVSAIGGTGIDRRSATPAPLRLR